MSKDTTITIRIAEQEKEALKAAAAKRDVPVSQLIREAIKDYLKQE